MLTVENLRSYGANVEEGIKRCVNNEEFYLDMVGKALSDPTFDKLVSAIGDKNLDDAFEIAHALKGVLSNLALTPLAEPVSEMVELLRNRTDTDYGPYIAKIKEKKDELVKLI